MTKDSPVGKTFDKLAIANKGHGMGSDTNPDHAKMKVLKKSGMMKGEFCNHFNGICFLKFVYYFTEPEGSLIRSFFTLKFIVPNGILSEQFVWNLKHSKHGPLQ